MPTVYIDGNQYHVNPGRNMLEAALDNGLNLPYFCWHPAMRSVGACRLCAVRVYKDESDTKGRIQMACMTPAVDGTRISIKDPEAAQFRRCVIEWLMTNHPHDCPVCDEGGECHLQDMTTMCGQVYRRFRFAKRTYQNQNLGPFVAHEMNRCIQCYRCVRFYRNLAGGRDLDVFASKNHLYFGRKEDGVLQSEFSGNLVEVCPTGVFTDKTYAQHYTRKWDLQTAPSVCIHCGLGCNTNPCARYGMLRRVTSRFNGDVNGYFLCDRGRFGYEFVNSPARLREAQTGKGNLRAKKSSTAAIGRAAKLLQEAKGAIGIGSPRASLESNYALRKLVGEANFSLGLSAFEKECAQAAIRILQDGPARTPSLAEIEDADVVLILGADPTNEAPMLDFAIRQAMRKAPLDVARKLKIPDWDANAVATALQGAKGKLYIAAPWAVKLEEIGMESLHGAPPELVALAHKAEDCIRENKPDSDDIAARLASDLLDARQPLIATSISAGLDVLEAAANLARALCEAGKACWLFITTPEANTMGVASIGGMSVQEVFDKVEAGTADTLIVLENDLARRVSSARFSSVMPKVKSLVLLDCISTSLVADADVILSVPAYVETDGTFVNNEGRAQRFFQVFVPETEAEPAWRTIQAIAGEDVWSGYEDVLKELSQALPNLAGALEAAPPAQWRTAADQKVPRMAHRFSGRTAMNANVSIMEPQVPADDETPLAFSMEGDQNPSPGALIPRFWWPGWNSENSINKFQIEVGGPLKGGNPGKRLIEPSGEHKEPFGRTERAVVKEHEVWTIPHHCIFGSEELSRLAPGIAELSCAAEFSLHPDLAHRLGVKAGESVELEVDGQVRTLPARFDTSIARDVMSVPANFDGTMGIVGPTRSRIARIK